MKKTKKLKFQIGDKVRIAPATYKTYFDKDFEIEMSLEGEDAYLPGDVYTVVDYDGSYLPYHLNVEFGGMSFAANQLIKVDEADLKLAIEDELELPISVIDKPIVNYIYCPHKSTYHKVAEEIADILEEKNMSYGSSFDKCGEIINILYPDGISKEQSKDALVVVRIIDKLFRISNNKGAFAEDPWKDIAGYALLMCGSEEIKKNLEEFKND